MNPLLVPLFAIAASAAEDDLVEQIPGFDKVTSFKTYSGYLEVPGPFKLNEYDSLTIHYQFHTSMRSPEKDPVVTWHQGGPGGSSLYGLYGEMGYYQVDSEGTHTNPYSWNQVANMLYLESPAGSNDPIGFSTCNKGGKPVGVCTWSDRTQAEAYTHTLAAFFKAFPDFKNNDLYLTGESYAGQYVPNIANFILDNSNFGLNLKGLAVGNACWGGDANNVQCNGPDSEENDIDMYFGKGLISKPLYKEVQSTCNFPKISLKCGELLEQASKAVGPHNIYDIYDNCPDSEAFLRSTNKTMRWLKNTLRNKLNKNEPLRITPADLGTSLDDSEVGPGGYVWGCDAINQMGDFFRKADVQEALHLNKPGASDFNYHSSGPASVTLYPKLIQSLRVLIYNGDADACVPYKGNEQWTEELYNSGALKEEKAWHPWFAESIPQVPAGYATTYSTANQTDFSFITIRLAGHMVPAFQPAPALTFIKKFLSGEPF